MKTQNCILLPVSGLQIILPIFIFLIAGGVQAAEFKPIFDGSTLAGWESMDVNYWSVQDGAITGISTQEMPALKNQLINWKSGKVDDFELKLKYRISGSGKDDAGVRIQVISEDNKQFVGYNCRLDENTTENATADGWNDCYIIAADNCITLQINGQLIAESVNNQAKTQSAGILALQFQSADTATVQFKDIQLKRLPLTSVKKIVLIAGTRSHGYGAHEHNAGCLLLERLLNENLPSAVYATTYFNGWPQDPTALDNADAVVVFCDGGQGHVVMRHLEELDEHAKKGLGIAMLHYAVEVPQGQAGDYMVSWIGGYFETFWSVNPFWDAKIEEFPVHPITSGVKPFEINDEWYYHMRFTEDTNNLTPILTTVPPDSTRREGNDAHAANPYVRQRMGMPEHIAWAYERVDGGRGFGFTGGHWHYNWASDNFRKLILNSLVWVAGAEVPQEGVASETPTIEQLEANQDYPDYANWDSEEIKQMIDRWNSR